MAPRGGLTTCAQFPAADTWVTAVGGTSLAIGENGTAVADYPWGDNVAQANAAGTGYTTALPGAFQGGSGGGVSAPFAQPGYQRPVVPAALATGGGRVAARRVVPDISANAGSNWWIGYTGAVKAGVYAKVICGGTSGSSPLIAGLEADAIQASGHRPGRRDVIVHPGTSGGGSAVQASRHARRLGGRGRSPRSWGGSGAGYRRSPQDASPSPLNVVVDIIVVDDYIVGYGYFHESRYPRSVRQDRNHHRS
jgi:hypothetical protein